MEPAESEGDHGAGSIRVVMRVGLVMIGGAVEVVFEGVELGGGVRIAAELDEGEEVEGQVGEVFVGFREEREFAGSSDLVEDGSP